MKKHKLSTIRRLPSLLVILVCFSNLERWTAFCPQKQWLSQQQERRRNRLAPIPGILQSSASGQEAVKAARKPVAKSNFKEDLRELKDSINLVSVVAQFDLEGFHRRDSERATACCPFHDDKTPSMLIGPERYKCFGCGATGDVFNFVQEYYSNQTFGETIQFVKRELLPYCREDGTTQQRRSLARAGATRTKGKYADTPWNLKKRLLLANAAAAAFYADCFTRPAAGGARQYVLSRSFLSQATVLRKWGLGFAPDTYYSGKSWGEGSLVEHLKEMGFTPNEIVQAGLAKPTKRGLQQQELYEKELAEAVTMNPSGLNGTTTGNFTYQYEHLMDRFRGRLVVPIWDTNSQHVLGFGGRLLPSTNEDKLGPKYLNSPESAVFTKSQLLFGLAAATAAYREQPQSMILVEGYMDAIALSSVGISTAVASMGTSISKEQLELLASCTDSLVLCLDNDTAGKAAVERLCKNGFLAGVNSMNIRIAQLPDDLKDPADFVEGRLGSSSQETVRAEFMEQVIEPAQEWTQWYVLRLVEASYNATAPRGTEGSFGDIFERVADFMGVGMEASERAKNAPIIAKQMETLLLSHENSTTGGNLTVGDGTLHVQLEADLLDLSSRIASAKEAGARMALADLSLGSWGEDDSMGGTVSRNPALPPGSFEDDSWGGKVSSQKSYHPPQELQVDEMVSTPDEFQKPRRMRGKQEPQDLTPHFAGFEFSHQTDAEWLGLSKWKKKKRPSQELLLHPAKTSFRPKRRDPDHKLDYIDDPSLLNDQVVYFNSNLFHGEQFLTEGASMAGYVNQEIEPDPSFVEKGVGVLIKQDTSSMRLGSEDALLRSLIRCVASRASAKRFLEVRSTLQTKVEIFWSNPAKEWLFRLLIGGSDHQIPPNIKTASEMRSFLVKLEGVPVGAFEEISTTLLAKSDTNSSASSINGTVPTLQVVPRHGILDHLFDNVSGSENILDENEEEDYLAQEALATLMWACAAEQAQTLKEDLIRNEHLLLGDVVSNVSLILEEDRGDDVLEAMSDSYVPANESDKHYTSSSSAEHDPKGLELVRQIRDTTNTLRSLSDTSKRITQCLVNSRKSSKLGGRNAIAMQTSLAAKLDEHLKTVLEQSAAACSAESDALVFTDLEEADGIKEEDSESYEDALERMEKEWGEMFRDDYVWSGEGHENEGQVPDILLDQIQSFGDEEEQESLDDALARIDEEWGDWDT